MMIIILVLGVIGSIYLVNYLKGKPGFSIDGIAAGIKGDSLNPSLEILQKRYASGEISRGEFNEIRDTILQDEYLWTTFIQKKLQESEKRLSLPIPQILEGETLKLTMKEGSLTLPMGMMGQFMVK